MDFTREPIVETVITPKEGYKLVVRSSKSTGQEEYFVDAVEVVSFGHSLFFRSIEKPKCFLVPVSDYEVLEVREARMVLKNVGVDQSIKIAGGRETHIRAPREVAEKTEPASPQPEAATAAADASVEAPAGKKRERRRHSRRRRGHDEAPKEDQQALQEGESQEKIAIQPPEPGQEGDEGAPAPLLFSALLQPPPTLISETIGRYKETFKEAFFTPETEALTPHDKMNELMNEEGEEEAAEPIEEEAADTIEEAAEPIIDIVYDSLEAHEQADVEEPLTMGEEDQAIQELENPEAQLPSKDE